MFKKILIANRGEIACRIMRTARRLGLRTVAVYSEADANALHREMADESYFIGPPEPGASYLRIEAIIEAAKQSGAEAIHPGYGFLSENAAFARACRDAGITFIGPPAESIEAMGSKMAAKALMEKAGVPLIPGYHGEDQSRERLVREAERIGYPLLLKASAGGGGRGMRIVENPEGLEAGIEAAMREAEAAFGDGRLLIESLVSHPRHVEIQVFTDSHGNGVYLFERDCSIQRRHQKVLEEAPAPRLSPEQRKRMGEAGLSAARAIDYVGAGTVEFLLEPGGDFYFMEMNTRLQVEHPVTELITSTDLVEWQLRIAAGEPLPATQEQLSINGHAIEARLYAEDPSRGFLPASGRIEHLLLPIDGNHVRVDTGVREGDLISPYYDAMIAKLIVWDSDRARAVMRLREALAQCEIVGIANNVEFLARCAAHPAYAKADLDTGFIARHEEELIPAPQPAPDEVLAFAALHVLLDHAVTAERQAAASPDPYSPWHLTTGWRLNADTFHLVHLSDGDTKRVITAHYRPEGYLLELPGGELMVRGEPGKDHRITAQLGDRREIATVVPQGDTLTVLWNGNSFTLGLTDPALLAMEHEGETGGVTAPMPGRIVDIKVQPGQLVKRGEPLLIMEAMKMEHTVTAPDDCRVEAVHYSVGDSVEEGKELVSLTADE
ncbi:MAG: biotin carboxylase N-terminal domain-containing protein [Gammaproteobacteria bacterium]